MVQEAGGGRGHTPYSRREKAYAVLAGLLALVLVLFAVGRAKGLLSNEDGWLLVVGLLLLVRVRVCFMQLSRW